MYRDDDPVFVLTLSRSWLRESLRSGMPERLTSTLSLLQVAAVVRLLSETAPGDTLSGDVTVRNLPEGSADRGQGRLRREGSAPEIIEVSRTLDGSYQVLRSGLRGTLTLPKASLGLIYESTLWFVLGKLFSLGRSGEQRFMLLRELGEPGLLSGTLTLSEQGLEPLKLASEEVKARRLRYTVSASLGFPKDQQRGSLWIGPQGEVLHSDLWPQQRALAPMGNAENDPAFLLKRADGVLCRAEQREKNWLLTENSPGKKESPFEIELDFERRLQRLTSQRAGAPLSAEWDGSVLRYAYPGIPPRFVSIPEGGIALFLSSLFLPEAIPGLKVGQKRMLALFPLLTGNDVALPGTLERLPDDVRKRRHYRLTLEGGIVAELECDTRSLVRLTSNGPLTITRK